MPETWHVIVLRDPEKLLAKLPKDLRQRLGKAIDRLQNRTGWLERCMQAMAIHTPRALLWQRLKALERVLP